MSSQIYYITLTCPPGATIVSNFSLAYCDIIKVKRESRVAFICNLAPDLPQPAPQDGEVLYGFGDGSFTFNGSIPFEAFEKVTIIYKRTI